MTASSKNSDLEPVSVWIGSRQCVLKSSEPERLERAAARLNQRLAELRLQKPLAKSSDLESLLMIELAMELDESLEGGKALLKRTDQLLEWIDNKLSS